MKREEEEEGKVPFFFLLLVLLAAAACVTQRTSEPRKNKDKNLGVKVQVRSFVVRMRGRKMNQKSEL